MKLFIANTKYNDKYLAFSINKENMYITLGGYTFYHDELPYFFSNQDTL